MNCQISGCANTATLKVSVSSGQYAGTTFYTCSACKNDAVSTLGKHAKVESLAPQPVVNPVPAAPKSIIAVDTPRVGNLPNLVGATAFSMILVASSILWYNNPIGWIAILILLIASGVGICEIAELVERKSSK
jgi:hypothetical protein